MHSRRFARRWLPLLALLGGTWLFLPRFAHPGDAEKKPGVDGGKGLPFRLPAGFAAERIAGPPLVEHPMFACFDERGRLFVADSLGVNPTGEQLGPKRPR